MTPRRIGIDGSVQRSPAPPASSRLITRGLAGIALLGVAILAYGLYLPAKAELAQHLIERAWVTRPLDGPSGKPWPWADTRPIAKLTLHFAPNTENSSTKQSLHRKPKDLYVLAGASGQALAFGPAHISASAAPGTSDNVVIAGHRDTHFSELRQLAPGAMIGLESKRSATLYRVTHSQVVHESRVDLIEPTGRAELTLITCYPFDAIVPGGPLRYVVHAEAVSTADTIPREAGIKIRLASQASPATLDGIDRRMGAAHLNSLAD